MNPRKFCLRSQTNISSSGESSHLLSPEIPIPTDNFGTVQEKEAPQEPTQSTIPCSLTTSLNNSSNSSFPEPEHQSHELKNQENPSSSIQVAIPSISETIQMQNLDKQVSATCTEDKSSPPNEMIVGIASY